MIFELILEYISEIIKIIIIAEMSSVAIGTAIVEENKGLDGD